MKMTRCWQMGGVVGLGLVLTGLTGCQTNVAGMTLPSGRYLQHPPQYFPPSPAFPLSRELAAMEAQNAGQPAAGGATTLPPPAPVTPLPAPPAQLPPPNPAPAQ